MTTGVLSQQPGMHFIGLCIDGPWIGTRHSAPRGYITLWASDGTVRGAYRHSILGWTWEPAK